MLDGFAGPDGTQAGRMVMMMRMLIEHYAEEECGEE